MTVDRGTYLATIDAANSEVLAALRHDLTTPVPSCPGWDLRELVRHLGTFERWAHGNVTTGRRVRVREIDGPGDDLGAWFAEGASALVEALRTTALDAPAWTWAGDRDAGWWLRRAVHEVHVHAWDATNATGMHPPDLLPEVAADGVDEYLTVFVPRLIEGSDWRGDAETIHLHATDADGEWHVTLTADLPVVERAHRKGDVAVRGAAADLYLALWGRGPLEVLEWLGEEDRVARWQRRIATLDV